MKNWKTTLAGAIFAGIIAAFTFYAKGPLNVTNLVIAVAVAVISYLASDANVEQAIKNSVFVTDVLPLFNQLLGKLSSQNPNSEILKDLHVAVNTLNDNVAALPSAVVAAVVTAPTAAPVAEPAAEPVIEVKPPIELYNKFRGGLLTDNPYTSEELALI